MAKLFAKFMKAVRIGLEEEAKFLASLTPAQRALLDSQRPEYW